MLNRPRDEPAGAPSRRASGAGPSAAYLSTTSRKTSALDRTGVTNRVVAKVDLAGGIRLHWLDKVVRRPTTQCLRHRPLEHGDTKEDQNVLRQC